MDDTDLASFLYRNGFLLGECSDVTVNAFSQSYRLHRIILSRAPFFSSLFSGAWADSSSNILQLDLETDDTNSTRQAFEIAIARLYGHVDLQLEKHNALAVLAVASF